MQARGDVNNPERYKQEVDFSGLLFERNITPTDFDGVLDFGGHFFVLIELKYQNAPLLFGQRLCLERVCDKLAVDSACVLIVATHNHLPFQKIDAAKAMIREFRWKGNWKTPKQPTPLRQGIDLFKAMLAQSPMEGNKVIRVSFIDLPVAIVIPPDNRPRVQSEFRLL